MDDSCADEEWQQLGSTSSEDWQLGSSDPPLYSSQWKPAFNSAHDISQVPNNILQAYKTD